jgi:hypothetical protein|tara:strand:+ start:168 stop:428 length:261 start_codon:yes stop_codon:yes gene_type:complete
MVNSPQLPSTHHQLWKTLHSDESQALYRREGLGGYLSSFIFSIHVFSLLSLREMMLRKESKEKTMMNAIKDERQIPTRQPLRPPGR